MIKKVFMFFLLFASLFTIGLNVSANTTDDNVFNDKTSIEADFENLGMDHSIYIGYSWLSQSDVEKDESLLYWAKPYVVAFSEYYIDDSYLSNYIYVYFARPYYRYCDLDYCNYKVKYSVNGNEYLTDCKFVCKDNSNLYKFKINANFNYSSENRKYDFKELYIYYSCLISDESEDVNVYDESEYKFDLDFNGGVDCNGNKVQFSYDSFCLVNRRECFSATLDPKTKYNFFTRIFKKELWTGEACKSLYFLNFDLPQFINDDMSKLLRVDLSYDIKGYYVDKHNAPLDTKVCDDLGKPLNYCSLDDLYFKDMHYDKKSIFYYEVDENGNYVLDSNGNKIRSSWYSKYYDLDVNLVNMKAKDTFTKDEFLDFIGNENDYNKFISYQFCVLFDEAKYVVDETDSVMVGLWKTGVSNLSLLSLQYENKSGELINVKVNSGPPISDNPITPPTPKSLLDKLLKILEWIIEHPKETLLIVLGFIFLPTILAIISTLSPSAFAVILSALKLVLKFILFPINIIFKLLWKCLIKIFKPSKSRVKTKKKKKKFDDSLSLRSKY